MKLSICMMVKDEEKILDRCLSSLQMLRDEIDSELIIVDTGSKDNTVKIAEKYTDKVYFHNWNNNFSEMRNITINYAKGEWVFIIDGDEVLDDCSDIIEFFNTGSYRKYNSAMVYVKNHVDYEEEKLSAVNPSPRLFKNGSIIYEGTVHNNPVYKQPTADLNSLIKHYGYVTDDKELMDKKFLRTSSLLKKELEKDPSNIYYRFQLSVSYNMHGDYEEGLKEIQQAYNLIKDNKDKLKEHIYIYNQWCRACLSLNLYKNIETICLEGIEIEPEYLDLYYYLGTVQVMNSKYDEAIKYYDKYIEILDNYNDTNISKNSAIIMYTLNDRESAFYNLAVSYYMKKDYEKAIYYGELLKGNNAIEKSLRIIIDSYVKLNKIEKLYCYYINLIELFNDKQDLFEKLLEKYRMNYTEEENNNISKEFSKANNIYGELNSIRTLFAEENDEVNKSISRFINTYNFNCLDNFYGDIIYISLIKNLPIDNIIIMLNENKIAELLEYISNKYKDIEKVIYTYLNNFNFNNSIESIKVKMILSRSILLLSNRESLENYKNIFDEYVKIGILYIRNIYNTIVFDKELVNELKNQSEKFLLYMFLANKEKESDKGKYIMYLKKALTTYPYMKDGIKILLDEMEEKQNSANNEMEQFKKQVKENINTMIEMGNLEEAKLLITEYENIVHDDVEIILFKSVIALKETGEKGICTHERYKM